jgi:hypothetical protein
MSAERTTQLWRAPNGLLHLSKSCPYGAPASQHRMQAVRLSDEQLAKANVCKCARSLVVTPPQSKRRGAPRPPGRDHDPHEITSGFETNRRRH